jgi:protein-S-isoprenylcysteine O-methyltransferase Ste14
MSQAETIAFVTIVLLGPIPLWHLLLHACLPAWRRSPGAFYALAAALWVCFVPLSWRLAETSPRLFAPGPWTVAAGLSLSGAAFLVFVWSVASLTPRRFFVWAVLRPDESLPERIVRGPYRYTAHPTYLAIVVAAASNLLASGQAVLLGAAVALGLLLAAVAVLEQRELAARLGASLPARELVPPSLAASTRE